MPRRLFRRAAIAACFSGLLAASSCAPVDDPAEPGSRLGATAPSTLGQTSTPAPLGPGAGDSDAADSPVGGQDKADSADAHNDLALIKGNLLPEEFLALSPGEPLALRAASDADAEKLDCTSIWSVDGGGHFSAPTAVVTDYFPAASDTRITVLVTCSGEQEVLQQDVAVKQ